MMGHASRAMTLDTYGDANADALTLHRHPSLRRVHWGASGLPCLEMTPEKDLDPRFENIVMKLIICARED